MTQPFDKLDITQFDVSRDRGFLCKYDPATVAMPTELAPLVEAGKWLPEWMATGVVRHYLKDIPEIDVTSFIESASDEQLRNAMVHYSFIVQAWVWGEAEPNHRIPRNIAVPLCLIADKLGNSHYCPTQPTCLITSVCLIKLASLFWKTSTCISTSQAGLMKAGLK